MTRENKIGLVVCGLFACVVGGVVAVKMRQPTVAVAAAPDAKPPDGPAPKAPAAQPEPSPGPAPAAVDPPPAPPPTLPDPPAAPAVKVDPPPVGDNHMVTPAAAPDPPPDPPPPPNVLPPSDPPPAPPPGPLPPPPDPMGAGPLPPPPAPPPGPGDPPKVDPPPAPPPAPPTPDKDPKAGDNGNANPRGLHDNKGMHEGDNNKTNDVTIPPAPPGPAPIDPPPPVKPPDPPPGPLKIDPPLPNIVPPPSAPPTINVDPPPPHRAGNEIVIPASGSPAAKPPAVDSWDERTYVCKTNDDFTVISLQAYKSEDFAAALQAYNRNHPRATESLRRDGTLKPGDRVYIPPAQILTKRHPELAPKPAAPKPVAAGAVSSDFAATPASFQNPPAPLAGPPPMPAAPAGPTYKVTKPGGEGWPTIAARTLGNADRWGEIAKLNPQVDREKLVPAGTVLNLPTSK